MAILKVLQYPDPRLRIKAIEVTEFGPSLQATVLDLYDTMYARTGVGLAATQVGIPYRLFVMDVSSTRDQVACYINPVMISQEGEQYEEEGCLSILGIREKVRRAAKVLLHAVDVEGKPFQLAAEGLMAVCIQHEIDHLDGRVFIDRLSELKRERIKQKLQKAKQQDTGT